MDTKRVQDFKYALLGSIICLRIHNFVLLKIMCRWYHAHIISF